MEASASGKLMEKLIKGKRLADDGIYLNEDRRSKPKEYFKFLQKIISHHMEVPKSVLDIGCATGEFLSFMKEVFPKNSYTGIDVSSSMINEAKKRESKINFFTGSILDSKTFEQEYDFVFCLGTVQIFDDLETPLTNILKSTKKGGLAYVFTLSNHKNVDLITRYRNSLDEDRDNWQLGWNIFSRTTYHKTLMECGASEIKTYDFEMPYPLPAQSDPMRSYHKVFKSNEKLLVNGAGLVLEQVLFEVKK